MLETQSRSVSRHVATNVQVMHESAWQQMQQAAFSPSSGTWANSALFRQPPDDSEQGRKKKTPKRGWASHDFNPLTEDALVMNCCKVRRLWRVWGGFHGVSLTTARKDLSQMTDSEDASFILEAFFPAETNSHSHNIPSTLGWLELSLGRWVMTSCTTLHTRWK